MDRRATLSLILQSLLLLTLLAAAIGYSQYGIYRKNAEIRQQAIEHNLSLLQLTLDSYLQKLVNDVIFMANSPVLKMYLRSQSPAGLKPAQDALMTLSTLREDYDQVRYIDRYGVEQIRVDRRDGISWLNRARQNKLTRDYVQAGLALAEGEVFLSELDLNIEHGVIEKPYQPMIRAVASVELGGEQQGMMVLNARGEAVLSSLRSVLPPTIDLMMLNTQGGWITGGGERDWAFMQSRGSGLAEQAPELWQSVKTQSQGWFELDGRCSHYAWYESRVPNAQIPRWLLVQHQQQSCSALAISSLQDGTVRLLIASSFSLPLLWLWYWTRLRAQRLQRHQEILGAQLEMVTKQADLGLLMVDRDCRVRWINPEAQRLLGWSEAELLGKNLHDTAHQTPDGRSLHGAECPTLKALETGQRYRNDYDRMISRSGEIVPLSIRVNAFGDGVQRQAIVTLADVSEYLERERKLTLLASTDSLTGALNRRSIMQNLQLLRDSAQIPPCVIMADIDFFKKVNDTYGHNAGDRVLISFVETVRKLLRRDDQLGRLGGEEFAVVVNHAQVDDAVALAERIRLAVQTIRCSADDGRIIEITASFGVAQYSGDETVDQLLARADQALYQAKHSGRNRVVMADQANLSRPPAATD